tara:strand:+ start:252 stop:434 length:183 start_codon:yes stop_codon:yes gene_type:complete
LSYEREDYLLIRNDKVIAVSGNADFSDGDNPIVAKQSDTVVQVVGNGDEIAYLTLERQNA